MADFPSYGDVLRRKLTVPNRDEIKATEHWTPVALPGRPGWWRHWVSGQQVDTQNPDAPTTEGQP